MSGLHKDIPVPLYHQLKDVILRGILAGQWKTDEQLPTENDLAERFNVSKITVRQALRELASLGYIRREQGRGTFVRRQQLEQGPRELTSFTEEMRRHGMVATSQVLEQGTMPATAEIAGRLRIKAGDLVFRLKRLRLADGEPMGLQAAYIPLILVPGIESVDFTNASLYELLHARYNLRPTSAKETHFAVLVTQEHASRLGTTVGSPAMLAERVTSLASGKPLEFARSIMRGDRYKIVLDLTTDPAKQR